MLMLKWRYNLGHYSIQLVKIDHHSVFIELIGFEVNVDPPIVTMKAFTLSLVAPELMGSGKNPFP